MSRCKACNSVMDKHDWEPVTENGREESVCLYCRQELLKCGVEYAAEIEIDEQGNALSVHFELLPAISLGFSLEEVDDALNGLYREYKFRSPI